MSSLHRSLEMERSSYNLTCGSIRLTILGNGKENAIQKKSSFENIILNYILSDLIDMH